MRLFSLLILITFGWPPATADTIAIIGTGDVGGALGPQFAAQGHTIVYGSRDPARPELRRLVERSGVGASANTQAESVRGADIVVLAVPGRLVADITGTLGNLSGKIIIDPTNPLQRNGLRIEHAVDSSNAEIIQKVAPGARVVKAFNALDWKTMANPQSAAGPVSVPLAGDDDDAKRVVARLVEAMGLEAIDVGPLAHARWVEGMLILWINNRYGTGESFDYYLRKTN